MWLYLLTIVTFLLGLGAAAAGIGPVAIVLFVLGAIALAGKVFGGSRGASGNQPTPSGQTMASTGGTPKGVPQDDETLDKAHVKTGAAHPGQEHMTPETIEGGEQPTQPRG